MSRKKNPHAKSENILTAFIVMFVLCFMAYLGWEASLGLLILFPILGSSMLILGARRDRSVVIEQYRDWSNPDKS